MKIEINPLVDEYEAFASIQRTNNPMSYQTAESLRHADQQMEPRHMMHRWVARHNDQVVGVSRMNYRPLAPSLDDLWIDVQVHPDFQGQGIGRQLYQHLTQAAQEADPKRLKVIVQEANQGAIAFANKHGFKEYARRWDSHLDIDTADLKPFLPSLDKVAANGIVIKPMNELDEVPDFEHKLYDLSNATTKDVPLPDPVAQLPFEQFKRLFMQNPAAYYEGSFAALDGDRFVGLTVILKLSKERLYVAYTAVDRDYRKKAIATALKVRSIQHGRDKGFKILGTTNDTANQAILALNDAFGFVRQPAQILLECDFVSH